MNPDISPVYLLRSYIWDVLKTNTTMDESDYGGKIPIVPVSEEPELSEYSGPHIVYGYAMNPTGDMYFKSEGSVTLVVYSQNFRAITKILSILQAAFERWDEAARSVNNYTTQVQAYSGIRFGYISVGFVEGGTPEDNEGGRQSGMINIRFCCFHDYDVNTEPIPTI